MADVVKHIAQNLRRLRVEQGLSQAELARRSGLSKGAVSQLEAATSNPTVETVWALAQALHRTFSELTTEPVAALVTTVRSHDGDWIEGRVISSRLLHRVVGPSVTETYDVRLRPGATHTSPAHAVGLVEQLVLRSGRVVVGPESSPATLDAGDSVLFAADVPHVYSAEVAAEGVLVMYYATPSG